MAEARTGLPRRRAKIVCTLGPSSSSPERIRELVEAGMDVARLNFSHGSHAFHRGLIENVRAAAAATGRPVAIMQDLQGPKLRAGKLPGGAIELIEGERLWLFPEGEEPRAPAGARPVPISAEIAESMSRDVKRDAKILFDDGKLCTRVLEASPPRILVEVEVGGRLSDNKGMNLPGTPLTMGCLTDKDIEDLKFGLEMGVDAVALSFVRKVDDIDELKDLIRDGLPAGKPVPWVVAKIEREEAIDDMDAIIEVTDALLIARGDMAVEIGAQRVPVVQKRLIASCNELGVPVITATQMLESMISSPTPTRAEASDVANAVFDGTDAVMLSGETAGGKYPVEAVRTMARIVEEAEISRDAFAWSRAIDPLPGSIVDSVEHSAARIAEQVGAVAIACLTHSGTAARTLAKFRPRIPILALTEDAEVLRKLAFVWGIRGDVLPEIMSTDDIFLAVENMMRARGWASNSELVVITAGVPTLRRGTTNTVKVHRMGGTPERKKK